MVKRHTIPINRSSAPTRKRSRERSNAERGAVISPSACPSSARPFFVPVALMIHGSHVITHQTVHAPADSLHHAQAGCCPEHHTAGCLHVLWSLDRGEQRKRGARQRRGASPLCTCWGESSRLVSRNDKADVGGKTAL